VKYILGKLMWGKGNFMLLWQLERKKEIHAATPMFSAVCF